MGKSSTRSTWKTLAVAGVSLATVLDVAGARVIDINVLSGNSLREQVQNQVNNMMVPISPQKFPDTSKTTPPAVAPKVEEKMDSGGIGDVEPLVPETPESKGSAKGSKTTDQPIQDNNFDDNARNKMMPSEMDSKNSMGGDNKMLDDKMVDNKMMDDEMVDNKKMDTKMEDGKMSQVEKNKNDNDANFNNPATDMKEMDMQDSNRTNVDVKKPDMKESEMGTPDMMDKNRPTMEGPDMRRPVMQTPDMKDPNMKESDMKESDMQRPDMKDSETKDSNMKDSDVTDGTTKDSDMRKPDMKEKEKDMKDSDMRQPGMQDKDMNKDTGKDMKDKDMKDKDTKGKTMPDVKRPSMPDVKKPSMPDVKRPAMPDVKKPAMPDVKRPEMPDTKRPDDEKTSVDDERSKIGRKSLWMPKVGTTWQIVLRGAIDIRKTTSPNVEVFDIDAYENSAATIKQLHDQGKKVICYFSAGTYENYREDRHLFKQSDLGEVLEGWPDERWIKLSSPTVRSIMAKRIKTAASKGCDAIDPDNVDGYSNKNGLGLTKNDTIDFMQFLTKEARSYNMSTGLKNAGDVIDPLLSTVDFAVNEQCVEYSECAAFAKFIKAGKPVFHIEYPAGAPWIGSAVAKGIFSRRGKANGSEGFSTVVKKMNLDGWVRYFDGSVANTIMG